MCSDAGLRDSVGSVARFMVFKCSLWAQFSQRRAQVCSILRRLYENKCRCEHLLSGLSAIVGRVVAAEVRFAEGVAVWAVGTHCGVVARSVVEVAVVLWVMAEAVVSIACAVF